MMAIWVSRGGSSFATGVCVGPLPPGAPTSAARLPFFSGAELLLHAVMTSTASAILMSLEIVLSARMGKATSPTKNKAAKAAKVKAAIAAKLPAKATAKAARTAKAMKAVKRAIAAKEPAKATKPTKATKATKAAATSTKAPKSAPKTRRAAADAATVPAKPAAKATSAMATKPDVAKAAIASKHTSATTAIVDESGLGWIDAGKGYQLTLDGGKLAATNPAGKRLASVPKEIKDGDAADQLEALRDWLKEHDAECLATVDLWMLRSLTVPRAVIEAVWDDPSWRRPLENAVVVAVTGDGGHDHAKAGLLRGADRKKGVGVVDLDGETVWLATDRVAIPHPILLPELDAWRELVTQLGVAQGIAQLHRETHPKPPDTATRTIDQFEDGKFAMLVHAVGKARSLGFKVRGGFATCKVWDKSGVTEARYWIGSDSPDSVTHTGSLSWVDGRERGLAIADVGPIAFSEGMRMASSIYSARVIEKEDAS